MGTGERNFLLRRAIGVVVRSFWSAALSSRLQIPHDQGGIETTLFPVPGWLLKLQQKGELNRLGKTSSHLPSLKTERLPVAI